MRPVAISVVMLFSAMCIAGPLAAAGDALQAVLSIKVREPAKDVPPRLIQEITAHVTRQIREAQVLNTVGRGPGRFAMTVALPPEERLKFEKMVVELPTATFSVPVDVESWNINTRGDSASASDDTTAPADVHFLIDVDRTGAVLSAVKLNEVPVKDVLSYLARTVRLQYVCPDEIAARAVWADLRGVTIEEFLKSLKISLGVELVKSGSVWVFSNKESRQGR